LLNAGSGGAISIPVEAGTYCVSIYDVGSIGSGEAGFAISIAYP
jgi:predicted RNA-binding protein with TRAM domain